ncbi:hypothetical protein, partial [Enterocloster clostridioformis]|uniref:hypothetical protein n=1 Tax=Enterocloster clostridioformis TaxID=1531 RepID=UPI00248122FB
LYNLSNFNPSCVYILYYIVFIKNLQSRFNYSFHTTLVIVKDFLLDSPPKSYMMEINPELQMPAVIDRRQP